MQKTLYFCDKCGKQTATAMNGDIKNNLYTFLIDNPRQFPNIDKHGINFEVCGECAEEFASILEVFYSYYTKSRDIYKEKKRKQVQAISIS